MPTYSEIQEQIRKLQKQAEEIREKELADVINDIKEKIQQYRLTKEDLGLGGKQKRPKSEVRAKYKKGNLTWAGRGRQPKWVAEHLEAGGSLEDLLI